MPPQHGTFKQAQKVTYDDDDDGAIQPELFDMTE